MNKDIFLIALLMIAVLSTSCKKEVHHIYFTNLETLTADSKSFVSSEEPMLFQNSFGSLRTSNTYSGKNSVLLGKKIPFGLTVHIKNIVPGERVIGSIWRNANGKGFLVIENPAAEYYFKSNKIVETDSTGWERIEIDEIIPEKSKTNYIKIYIWNPDTIQSYFDDFKIERIRFE